MKPIVFATRGHLLPKYLSNFLRVDVSSSTAKIADVGLARFMSGDHMTQMSVMGTLAWSAPEVMRYGFAAFMSGLSIFDDTLLSLHNSRAVVGLSFGDIGWKCKLAAA